MIDKFAEFAEQGNGVPLWASVSGMLGVTGKRGRVAAAHGLASMAAGSAIANGVVKKTVHRRRPVRMPWRPGSKSTPSFPSSHATSAAAYATAASLAMPKAAIPLVAIAGTVAWTRVLQRQHYPSDVLAGIALGAITGFLTHRVLPGGQEKPQAGRA